MRRGYRRKPRRFSPGDYAGIPQEMKAAASFFGKKVLREVDPASLSRYRAVRKACGDRAVLRAMALLCGKCAGCHAAGRPQERRLPGVLKAWCESGGRRSSTCKMFMPRIIRPEQGLSVALALSEKLLDGCGAWRVHGGGFAGTIQGVCPV